jgi:hypothetical protein
LCAVSTSADKLSFVEVNSKIVKDTAKDRDVFVSMTIVITDTYLFMLYLCLYLPTTGNWSILNQEIALLAAIMGSLLKRLNLTYLI